MGCPHFLCLQTRERARRPDRVTSETTPCLAGGIGLPRLHEAREAPSSFPPFPCFSLGGSSSARLGTRAVVAQSVEQPGEVCRRFNSGQRKRPAPEAPYGCRKERRPACRLEAGGSASPPDKTHPSVSSSRDGWPYLSQSTTVDGAHRIAFLRPNIQPP